VRRQAISDDTPANIKTSLPKPEPVPTSPPMIVIESKAAMAIVGRYSLPCVCVWPFSYCIFPVVCYCPLFQLDVDRSRVLFVAS
jgi:hypothetical protein